MSEAKEHPNFLLEPDSGAAPTPASNGLAKSSTTAGLGSPLAAVQGNLHASDRKLLTHLCTIFEIDLTTSAFGVNAAILLARDALQNQDFSPLWIAALDRLAEKTTILHRSSATIELAALVKSSPRYKLASATAAPQLNRAHSGILASAKAILFAQTLTAGSPLDLTTFKFLSHLLKGRSIAGHEFDLTNSSLETFLTMLLDSGRLNDEQFRGATRLKKALTNEGGLDFDRAFTIAETTHSKLIGDSEDDDVDELDDDTEGTPKSQNQDEECPLITIKQIEVMQCSRSHAAGIDASLKQVQHDELTVLVPQLIALLRNDDTGETACAALCALVLSTPLRHFSKIKFEQNEEGIWLTKDCTHLRWDISGLSDIAKADNCNFQGCIPTTQIVSVPLPQELSTYLKQLFSKTPEAKTLQDLFSQPKEKIARATKLLLRSLSTCNLNLTASRLRASYGTFVLEVCRDPALAMAITTDFAVGALSEFHYLLVEPEKLNSTVRDAYKKLGFSGAINSLATENAGSSRVAKNEVVFALLKSLLDEANESIAILFDDRTPKHLAPNAFNKISNAVACLVLFTTGLRAAHNSPARQSIPIGRGHLDLTDNLVLIHDKNTNPQQWTRLVPLPQITADWIANLLSAAERLKYFLPTEPQKRRAIDAQLFGGSFEKSIFFQLNVDFEITPLGTKAFDESFQAHGLDVNSARHWYQYALRGQKNIHLTGVDILAVAGRGGYMQSAFVMHSAISPIELVRKVGAALDSAMAALNKHKLTPPMTTKSKPRTLTPIPTANVVNVPRVKRDVCHFAETDLSHVELGRKALQCWLESPPQNQLVNFGLSLIFFDGVSNLEQWQKLMEIALGLNTPVAFIDTSTPNLGLRRLYLSNASRQLLKQVANAKVVWDGQVAFDSLLADVNIFAQISGLKITADTLITCEASRQAIYSPVVLSAYCSGEILGRVAESAAAHGHHCQSAIELSAKQKESTRTCKSNSQFSAEMASVREIIAKIDERRVSNSTKARLAIESLTTHPVATFCAATLRDYAIFLFQRELACSSVERYLSAVYPVLERAASTIEALEDMQQTQLNAAFSNELKRIKSVGSPSTLEVAEVAINHLYAHLGWRELDGTAKGPKPFFTYAQTIPAAAYGEAITFLNGLDIGEATKKKAIQILNLLEAYPFRRSELQWLQGGDLDRRLNCCFISTQNRGDLKSFLSKRLMRTQKLDVDLMRTSRNGSSTPLDTGDPKQWLFSNGASLPGENFFLQCLNLSFEALRTVTAQLGLHPHNARHTYATVNSHSVTLPSGHARKGDSLNLRNKFVHIAADLGHADELLTTNNYVTGFDLAQREWFNLRLIALNPADSFVSAILGTTTSTVRSWRHRQHATNADFLIRANSRELAPEPISTPARNIKAGIRREIPSTGGPVRNTEGFEPKMPARKYILYCIAGMNPTTALHEANLSAFDQPAIDASYAEFSETVKIDRRADPELNAFVMSNFSKIDALVDTLKKASISRSEFYLLQSSLRGNSHPLVLFLDSLIRAPCNWMTALSHQNIDTRLRLSDENLLLETQRKFHSQPWVTVHSASPKKVSQRQVYVSFSPSSSKKKFSPHSIAHATRIVNLSLQVVLFENLTLIETK